MLPVYFYRLPARAQTAFSWLFLLDHTRDHASWRRSAGADCAGPTSGSGPAGPEWHWTDHAGDAADHYQHRRDPADSGKPVLSWMDFPTHDVGIPITHPASFSVSLLLCFSPGSALPML